MARRKACRCCPGLTNPSDCDSGRFDSDHIGPWSLWQGNLNAELVVIGQDWGDKNNFEKYLGRDKPNYRTNETLKELLSVAGIEVELPSPTDSGGGRIFFTNAVLCLKEGEGGMQAKVDPAWFANCGERFLRPTLDLIAPTAVVALGQRAYQAVCQVYGLQEQPFRSAVEADGTRLPTGPTLVPVYHCGARILNTHRPLEMQKNDWLRVRRALAR